MKKFLSWVLAIGELIAAAIFFANGLSDIQLGFGLVFLFLGIGAVIRLA